MLHKFSKQLFLLQWKNSLTELDLSWNTFLTDDDLDKAVEAITAEPQNSHLGILNLSGTAVSVANVRYDQNLCQVLWEIEYSIAESSFRLHLFHLAYN